MLSEREVLELGERIMGHVSQIQAVISPAQATSAQAGLQQQQPAGIWSQVP